MEKQIIYNVLDGEITFDPQIVEYGRLREEFNDYDDELAQSISKFYEENKSSIMDMYLGENKYYDFMFRLYAEITENIKEHMKKYINIMIDHGVYDVEPTEIIMTKVSSAEDEVIALEILKSVMENLTIRQQNIITLKLLGYSNTEICLMMEMSKSSYYRELENIRQTIVDGKF